MMIGRLFFVCILLVNLFRLRILRDRQDGHDPDGNEESYGTGRERMCIYRICKSKGRF